MANHRMNRASLCLTALTALAITGCGSSTEPDPDETAQLAFTPGTVELGLARGTSVDVSNVGTQAVGPVALVPGSVSRNGVLVAEVRLQVTPTEIPTLNPGSSTTVTLTLVFDAPPAAGSYAVTLAARVAGQSLASLPIGFSVASLPPPGPGHTVAITSGPSEVRQGDVVSYVAEVRDSTGTLVSDSTLAWSATPVNAGLSTVDGRFVGYTAGPAKIIAALAGVADTLEINISDRGLNGSFIVAGRGRVTARYTSDLWVHDFVGQGNFAYTGTWGCRSGLCGDRMYVWNVDLPGSPSLSDSILVDARVVNDVKIRADGTLAVITHESSNDGQNGVTLLDLADPAHPVVIGRFTTGLESGVHNTWVEGDYVYVVVDGAGNGLRILDISDPSDPRVVSSFYAGSSFLHDVYVRDGLAFLSHWNAGLVILDVGNGVAGGSPTQPVEVSRIATAGGQTHNAWYWPASGYVFVGEEDFTTPGTMHVVDVSDLSNPQEVATFAVPGVTPHNFWVDESRGILYAAWYENGVRALDVSGALLGELERQGREIASIDYGTGFGCQSGEATCTWAPQLHNGHVFASDLNSGLWVLTATF